MLKFAKTLIEDLSNAYTIVAVFLDFVFFICKVSKIKILLHLSYAWVLLPMLLVVLVTYYQRYKAYQELIDAKPNRDVWLLNAIWKTHTGRWKIPGHTIESDDQNYWERLYDKANEIRQYAADGKLPIWGKRQNKWNALWELITPEYWLNHSFDPMSFYQVPDPENLKTMGAQEWKSFMTDKTKVEKLWPSRNP